MLRRRADGLALLVGSAALAACVAYDAAPATLPAAVAELPRHDGALTFEAAVALAMAHNGELQALAAECRAAGLDVPPTELQGQLQQESLAVMLDPIALLGYAQRGASASLAATRVAEAAAALAQARWQIATAIAAVFVRQRALAELPPVPGVATDAAAFSAAGLASPVAAEQLRGAVAAAAAEQQAIDLERQVQLAELRRLLGLAPASALDVVLPPVDWPPLAAGDEAALLRRPDLALALARYQTADAAFRKAVADQYPALMLGPDVPLRGGAVDPMAILRLPLGAAGPAAAAREQRSAARGRLADAVALAANEAASAAAALDAAAAREVAARAGARASLQALTAATAAVQVEVDAFERVAEAAVMAVRDARESREAAVAAAQARVRAAVAVGWPTLEAHR